MKIPDSRLRDIDEIQRAHDLLVQVLLDPDLRGELFENDDIACVSCATSVLCWVLHHEHNPKFARGLARVEKDLKDMGGIIYKVKRDGEEQNN